MENEKSRYRLFTRRSLLLGGVQAVMTSALVGRLYYLQVVEADRYKTLAEENAINMRLLAPSRGLIFDRHGAPLAVNRQNFKLVVVPEQAGNLEAMLRRLALMVDLDEDDIQKALREARRRRAFDPLAVKENLPWDQVATVDVAGVDLPGVSIEVGEIRHYPYGEDLAHVLGYVGAVSEAELQAESDRVLSLPGFRIGKNGVEKRHELNLRGSAGLSRVEVNAFGRVVREVSRDEGKPGRSVALTLDVDVQRYVAQRLSAEKSAAAVVMDVATGEIHALASSPAYDPNRFARGIPTTLWRELISNPTAPLANKAISGQYPPGSTFKMVAMLAALESGVPVDYTAYCGGSLRLGNHTFHCWKRGGHGRVGMVDSLKHSCDVFYYEIAQKVGIEKIAAMARKFGLGSKLGVELPAERSGLIPDPDWKRGRFDQPWQKGETLIAAIGQGYVLATPLQLATMTARMASGRAVMPHLTLHVDGLADPPNEFPPLDVDPRHLALAREGMLAVTRDGGTAYKARILEPEFEMAGKTGTSQVRRITMAQRTTGVPKAEDVPWRERDHGLFVGYAPAHAPRYAVAVIVEHGGGGSTAAAPIARDILLDIQKRAAARAVGGTPPAKAG